MTRQVSTWHELVSQFPICTFLNVWERGVGVHVSVAKLITQQSFPLPCWRVGDKQSQGIFLECLFACGMEECRAVSTRLTFASCISAVYCLHRDGCLCCDAHHLRLKEQSVFLPWAAQCCTWSGLASCQNPIDVCLLTLQLALHLFSLERLYIFLWVLKTHLMY